jgi:hypothetical protein
VYARTIVNGTKPTEDNRLDQKGTDCDDPIAMHETFGWFHTHPWKVRWIVQALR